MYAKVDRFGEDKVRCMVNLRGFTVPVAFPRSIIEYHNMSVGDDFEWTMAQHRPIEPEDCVPYSKEMLSIEEVEELKKMLERLPKYKDTPSTERD